MLIFNIQLSSLFTCYCLLHTIILIGKVIVQIDHKKVKLFLLFLDHDSLFISNVDLDDIGIKHSHLYEICLNHLLEGTFSCLIEIHTLFYMVVQAT